MLHNFNTMLGYSCVQFLRYSTVEGEGITMWSVHTLQMLKQWNKFLQRCRCYY